jgi:hypothetical protein
MDILLAILLVVLNTLGILLVLVGLPGTWFILLATAGVSAISGRDMASVPTIAVLAALALAGEVLEFAAGAAGSRKAGGSWRATVGAIILGLVGGIVGSFVLPVIGSLLGACMGAFAGALLGELSAGKDLEPAINVGANAFVGRFLGTVLKLGVAVAMWAIATVASLVA